MLDGHWVNLIMLPQAQGGAPINISGEIASMSQVSRFLPGVYQRSMYVDYVVCNQSRAALQLSVSVTNYMRTGSRDPLDQRQFSGCVGGLTRA